MDTELHHYIEKHKKLQLLILAFLDESDNSHQFDLANHPITQDSNELRLFLHSLVMISNNHRRGSNFFNKIFNLLSSIKTHIINYYSNMQIFNIFSRNKRILLFLIQDKILQPDVNIASMLIQQQSEYEKWKYSEYFYPEFKSFFNEQIKDKIEKELSDMKNSRKEFAQKFEENRKEGENEEYICQLIRKDEIDEFIKYVNQTNFDVQKYQIKPSIFETNEFLLEEVNYNQRKPTLIEYSAFFGSINIFNYLYLQNCELNSEIWLYSIHGNNPE